MLALQEKKHVTKKSKFIEVPSSRFTVDPRHSGGQSGLAVDL
jgi:hypothetical protein